MSLMNSKKTLLVLAAASALCAGSAFAGEIYRYTGEDGVFIYVDRPTGDPTEERLDISSLSTNNAAVQARVRTRHDAATAAAEAKEKADEGENKMTRGEKVAAAEARRQECQLYRDRYDTFVFSRRLYREDGNGERVYLSDKEKQESLDLVQEKIDETCD